MIQVHLEAPIKASTERVWERITDHADMPAWSPLSRVDVTPGASSPNGLGAVRRMYLPGPLPPIVEEVVAWEAGKTFSYTVRAGAPLRDHLGQVTVEADGDQSRVTWRVSFRPMIPGTGWLIRAVLGRALTDMLKRLERLLLR